MMLVLLMMVVVMVRMVVVMVSMDGEDGGGFNVGCNGDSFGEDDGGCGEDGCYDYSEDVGNDDAKDDNRNFCINLFLEQ